MANLTITPVIIRDLLGVDTRTDLPYAHFKEADLLTDTDENRKRWLEAGRTVFGVAENAKTGIQGGYQKSKMTPLMQILWRIGLSTFHPRSGNLGCSLIPEIQLREIYLCHAVFTGKYLYSFAHLMIDDIWDMYEHENQKTILHGYYISEILDQLGVVSEDEYAEVVSPQYRQISRRTFVDLEFSESHNEYIIDDRKTEQRATFPKKVIIEEVSPQPTPRFPQPPQMPAPNAHVDMTWLLTNLQKSVDIMQKQMERQALETERREQEREKRAEIRAHAIIWDLERQHYFYEKEQKQLQIVGTKLTESVNFSFHRYLVPHFIHHRKDLDTMTHPKEMRSQRSFNLSTKTSMARVFRSFTSTPMDCFVTIVQI